MTLAASNGTLYWSDTANHKVYKMSTTAVGATPTPISGAETIAPTLVVVRGPTVFWLDGRVIRKSVCGTISVVGASAVPINGLTASDDGSTVFFSTGDGSTVNGGKVQRVAAAGGNALDVAIEENMGIPGALATSGGLVVYPTDINGDVDIAAIGPPPAQCWGSPGEEPPGKMNVGCDRIARSQGSLNLSVILVSGGNVVWIDGHNIKMNAFGLTAPAANKSVASPDNNVHSLAIGGSEVFFVEFDDAAPATGTVQKTPMIEWGHAHPARAQPQRPGLGGGRRPEGLLVDGRLRDPDDLDSGVTSPPDVTLRGTARRRAGCSPATRSRPRPCSARSSSSRGASPRPPRST
jgi:hypothetical protein